MSHHRKYHRCTVCGCRLPSEVLVSNGPCKPCRKMISALAALHREQPESQPPRILRPVRTTKGD